MYVVHALPSPLSCRFDPTRVENMSHRKHFSHWRGILIRYTVLPKKGRSCTFHKFVMGSAIALPVVGEVNDLRLAYGSRALIMVEVRSVG